VTGAYVLDASVTFAWLFRDEADAGTDALLDALRTHGARVPTLWWLEVVNVLVVAERKGRLTAADAARFVALLERLPITIDRSTPDRAANSVASLARAHRLSAYDAAYLDLALREGLPLATRDEALRQAAAALGIALP
jgi:predicted nucleic acid-binding protein